MRDDMHPADEFEAFRDLVDKGLPTADIAARFGTSETVVRQRVKARPRQPRRAQGLPRGQTYPRTGHGLRRVRRPRGAGARSGELAPAQRDPRIIRDALTENEIPASDRRVKFVTLKAYEKAGGQTRRDLFSARRREHFHSRHRAAGQAGRRRSWTAPPRRLRRKAGNGRKPMPTSATSSKFAIPRHPSRARGLAAQACQ